MMKYECPVCGRRYHRKKGHPVRCGLGKRRRGTPLWRLALLRRRVVEQGLTLSSAAREVGVTHTGAARILSKAGYR